MGAIADILTLAALAIAYWAGRRHQARDDERSWTEYAAWLRQQRKALSGRFLDIRA